MSWPEEIGIGTRVVVNHSAFKDSPLYEGIIIGITKSFYCVRRTGDRGMFANVVPAREEWLKKDRIEPLL